MRAWLPLIAALPLAGCAVNQGMTLKRVAHYDAAGKLTGYTVEETVLVPQVLRPLEAAEADIVLFEVGNPAYGRTPPHWPPPASGTALRRAGPKTSRRDPTDW